MTYPCSHCNMDEGSPVCLQDERCHNMPSMDATLRAAARRSAKIIRPAPDCRTCARCYSTKGRGVFGCDSVVACTNGDRYQPLPPVKLWRAA